MYVYVEKDKVVVRTMSGQHELDSYWGEELVKAIEGLVWFVECQAGQQSNYFINKTKIDAIEGHKTGWGGYFYKIRFVNGVQIELHEYYANRFIEVIERLAYAA